MKGLPSQRVNKVEAPGGLTRPSEPGSAAAGSASGDPGVEVRLLGPAFAGTKGTCLGGDRRK